MNIDFAYRAHSHAYKIDPIIRSLLDLDFYKLLMQQVIYSNHFMTRVKFAIKNRTLSVKLGRDVNIEELREQLEHCRTLRFTQSELIWLTGQTFYGQTGIFHKSYIDYLRTYCLPEFNLWVDSDEVLHLEFDGTWVEETLWETISMAVINEMRYRKIMSTMSKFELDIMFARAKVKLHDKLQILKDVEGLSISDFGTRRRHSFLWQEYCVLAMAEVLGEKFVGTSNTYLAMKHGFEAIGTNAHELPMVFATLAHNDAELKAAQYKVLIEWQEFYRKNMLIFLPDTFGTTQFLKGADPMFANTWAGGRPDSKEPIAAGEELISWWKHNSVNPIDKVITFADGLDVNINRNGDLHNDIPTIHRYFEGRAKPKFGLGTMGTNDFIGCHPGGADIMKPISLVCKVAEANGRPAVKLSDNYSKMTGETTEVERYVRVFGTEGMENAPTLV